MGRILAVDYGTRRIGLAVSDPLGITAQGLDAIPGAELSDPVEAIAGLAADRQAERIIVGLPLSLSGEAGIAAQKVLEFVERLRQTTDIPVETLDERMTSAGAQAVLKGSGLSQKKRRQAIDSMAAQILLQDYLARERRKKVG